MRTRVARVLVDSFFDNACKLRNRDITWRTEIADPYLGGHPSMMGGASNCQAELGEGAVPTQRMRQRGEQEICLDELDPVQTDGRHIFSVHEDDLLIASISPPDSPAITARLDLGAGQSRPRLLLRGDTLVVLGDTSRERPGHVTLFEPLDREAQEVKRPPLPATRIQLVDLADRARPRVVYQYELEGQLVRAWLEGLDLYLVSQAPLLVPRRVVDLARQLRAQGRSAHEVLARVEELLVADTLDELLPRGCEVRKGNCLQRAEPILGADQVRVYVPRQRDGCVAKLITLSHLRLTAPRRMTSVGVADARIQPTLLPTSGALYMVHGLNLEEPRISMVLRLALPPGERGVDGQITVTRLDGHPVASEAWSAHRGFLRAITKDVQGKRNTLRVLQHKDGALRSVGELSWPFSSSEPIAQEVFAGSVDALHIEGDRGFLATTRRELGPAEKGAVNRALRVLDLSEVSSPRQLGVHPIQGIPHSIYQLTPGTVLLLFTPPSKAKIVNSGWEGIVISDPKVPLQPNLHAQVFEVADPLHPRVVASADLGFIQDSWMWLSQSNVSYDPRSKVLAMPAEHLGEWALFRLEPNGLVALGRTDHKELQRSRQQLIIGAPVPKALTSLRGLLLRDRLFTLGPLGLQVNRLEISVAPMAAVLFDKALFRKGASIVRFSDAGGEDLAPEDLALGPTLPLDQGDDRCRTHKGILDALQDDDGECSLGVRASPLAAETRRRIREQRAKAKGSGASAVTGGTGYLCDPRVDLGLPPALHRPHLVYRRPQGQRIGRIVMVGDPEESWDGPALFFEPDLGVSQRRSRIVEHRQSPQARCATIYGARDSWLKTSAGWIRKPKKLVYTSWAAHFAQQVELACPVAQVSYQPLPVWTSIEGKQAKYLEDERGELVPLSSDEMYVYVTSPPVNGRAAVWLSYLFRDEGMCDQFQQDIPGIGGFMRVIDQQGHKLLQQGLPSDRPGGEDRVSAGEPGPGDEPAREARVVLDGTGYLCDPVFDMGLPPVFRRPHDVHLRPGGERIGRIVMEGDPEESWDGPELFFVPDPGTHGKRSSIAEYGVGVYDRCILVYGKKGPWLKTSAGWIRKPEKLVYTSWSWFFAGRAKSPCPEAYVSAGPLPVWADPAGERALYVEDEDGKQVPLTSEGKYVYVLSAPRNGRAEVLLSHVAKGERVGEACDPDLPGIRGYMQIIDQRGRRLLEPWDAGE